MPVGSGASADCPVWRCHANRELVVVPLGSVCRSGVQAIDPTAGEGSQSGYVLSNGQDDTYADCQTVTLDRAIEAVRNIVDHVTPDPRIQWRSW